MSPGGSATRTDSHDNPGLNSGLWRTLWLAGMFLYLALPSRADQIDPEVWPQSWLEPARTASEVGVDSFTESSMLAVKVERGEIPAVRLRLPDDPIVLEPFHGIGRHGGTARVFSSDMDRINPTENGLTVDPTASRILPNFIESWRFSDDARQITFKLRSGIRWSDGHPLTSDDFIFFHQHAMLNAEIMPVTPPDWVGSKSVRISDTEFRFEFREPFPLIINVIAQLGDFFIAPAHFMRNFHPAFVPEDELKQRMREDGYITWMAYFNAVLRWNRNHEPLAPTLKAYRLVRKTPVAEFYERNPYYFKVDPAGKQLPYIDRVRAEIVDNQDVLAAKAATGQVDYAGFELKTQDFPLFKLGEKTAGIKVYEWNRIHGSDVIIQPNLNLEDDRLRRAFQDVRFRKAMSLAINREEMNNIIYFGRGEPRQATVIPTSRFYEERFATAYAEYDPERAKRLLDEMGITDQDGDGMREFRDGEVLTVTLEYLDFETPKSISLELVTAYWREVGLDVRLKQVDPALQWNRATAGLMQMTVWHADRTTDILFPFQPQWYVPMHTGWEESHWNDWASYYLSRGVRGEKPPPEIQQLIDWWKELTRSSDPARVTQLGKNILASTADNVWTIGTIGLAPQPIVVSERMRNVAERGYWGWDNRWTMGYHASTWWLEE